MKKILEFIDNEGQGKYSCYKTKKYSLDSSSPETLDYDDRPAIALTSGKFAETDLSRVETVELNERLKTLATYPLFTFFLDGSRHVYKVDDIAVGNRIFPFLAGQIIVGCCQRISRETFKKSKLTRKLVLSLPINFNYDDDDENNFCRAYCDKINTEISKNDFVKTHNIKIDKILLYKTDGSKGVTQDRGSFMTGCKNSPAI